MSIVLYKSNNTQNSKKEPTNTKLARLTQKSIDWEELRNSGAQFAYWPDGSNRSTTPRVPFVLNVLIFTPLFKSLA